MQLTGSQRVWRRIPRLGRSQERVYHFPKGMSILSQEILIQASYAVTLLYVPMVFVIKIALLTIMLRIFSPDRHKVLTIYISMTVLLLYYIPALFIKIFFCKPISAYWTGTEEGGTCMDQRKVIIADSAISIASDLWILVLPVPMLWSLRMSRTKKLRVVGILGAGGLATGFSAWRLVMMIEEGKTADTTWFWIHAVLTAYPSLYLIKNQLTMNGHVATPKQASGSSAPVSPP